MEQNPLYFFNELIFWHSNNTVILTPAI
uniref:Uncharacterized protein n=1 Tax=Anguilla anguilla TaxID=7936 RepID=A0A0E9VMX9_ANGAN